MNLTTFSMAPLLMNSPDLPHTVREELRAALAMEPMQRERDEHLAAAARMLYEELAIDCSDARELVGLPAGSCY